MMEKFFSGVRCNSNDSTVVHSLILFSSSLNGHSSFRLQHQFTTSYWESCIVITMVQCVYKEIMVIRVS